MATSNARVRPLIAFLVLQMPCAAAERGEITLNQLTACDDLAKTQVAIRSWVDLPPNDCRPPSGAIELTLIDRWPAFLDGLCFLREPPSRSLSRFSCLLLRTKPSAQLICFRPTRLSDVRAYKSEFQGHHDANFVAYMEQAAKCTTSTSDTGALYPTTYPYPLMFVSRLEFGFIGAVKPDAHGSGYAIHAFARVDPSLRGAPDAIEAVSIFVGGSMPKDDPSKIHRTNGWRIAVDDGAIAMGPLNRDFRKTNAPIRLKAINFSLSRPADFSGRNKARIDQLHAELVHGLEIEGFKTDLRDLKLPNGKSPQEVMLEQQAQFPYGLRRLYSVSEMRGPLALLANEKRPACTSGGNGALAALVVAIEADPDEASDYGMVSLTVLGLGECARFTGVTGHYVRGLLADAKKRVFDSLE